MTARTTARARPATWLELIGRALARLAPAPARAVRAVRGVLARQRATTPGLLQILSGLILLLAVAVWVSATAVVSSAHRTTTAMAEETAPAIVAAGRAQTYLASADAAHAYHTARRDARATTLDQPYLYARKLGVKELGQAIANNTAGSWGASLLRSAEKSLSGYARLPYVSHFMHNPESGILHDIGRARILNRNAFIGQQSSAWLSPAVLVLVLVPAVGLLVLLIRTQLFLRRRFRRRLSLPLLTATGLVVALSGWTVGQVWHTQSELEDAGRSLSRITRLLQAQTLVAEAYAAELRALSAGPDQWFGQRTKALMETPLTEPVAPAVGTGHQYGNITTAEIDVGKIVYSSDLPTATKEGDLIAAVRQDFEEFTQVDIALDESVQRDGNQLDDVTKRLHDSALQLRDSLSQLIAAERERFEASMRSATSRLGLGVGVPLLALGIIAGTLAGVAPRLNEYHGWQDA